MKPAHKGDCRRRRAQGNDYSFAARAFSTVELAVSLGIFLFLSAVIALAVARSLGTSSEVRAARAGEAASADALAVLSTYPYDQLVAGSFTVPNPCPGTQEGIRGESCVRAGNAEVRVKYEYMTLDAGKATCSPTALVAGALDSEKGYVGLCAFAASPFSGAALPDQEVQTTTINSPGQTSNPYVNGGWVRVFFEGDVDLIADGAVMYLVKAGNPTAVVSTAPLRADNTAVFAVPEPIPGGVSCDAAAPCAIALSPTADPASLAGVGLYGPAARPGAAIVARSNAVVNAGAQISKTTALQLSLAVSRSTSAGRLFEYPRSPGSVCVWVSFDDGGDTVKRRVCNTESASTITVSSFTSSGVSYPIPPTPVTVTTDNPEGGCSSSSNTCTSWTWGAAQNLPATVELRPGQTSSFVVTWPDSTPAGGFSGLTGTWNAARSTPGCAADNSCSPVTANPEEWYCPGQLCLSGQSTKPSLVEPAGGFVIAGSGSTTFTMQAARGASPGVWAYMGSPPTLGVLSSATGVVSAGERLAGTNGSAVSWRMSFDRYPDTGNDSFTVRLCPTRSDANPFSCPGGDTVQLRLVVGKPAGTVQVSSFTVAQGGSTPTTARLVDVYGDPIQGAAIQFTAPGIEFVNGNGTTPDVALTDGNGVASITARAPQDTRAGKVGMTATALEWDISGKSVITVAGVPAQVLIDVSDVSQGGTSPLVATALDRTGNPLSGIALNARVFLDENPTGQVYAEGGGCTTKADGVCQMTLRAVPDARVGKYQVQVTAGSSTVKATELFDVLASLGGVSFTPELVLRAGQGPVPFVVTATDKGGANPGPITAVVTAPDGVTIPSTVTFDSNGEAAVDVSVAGDVAVGEYQVRFEYNGARVNAPLTVTAGGYRLQTQPLSLAQGASGPLQVTVTSAAGMPVSGVQVLTSSTTPGVTVESRTATDTAGLAQPVVRISDSVEAGTYPVTVQVDDPTVEGGQVTVVASVEVTSTPAYFVLSGTVPQGSQAGAAVNVYTYDGAGQVIGNIPVQLSTSSTPLQVSTGAQWSSSVQVTAAADGKAVFMLRDPVTSPSGAYNITLVAGDTRRTVPVYVTAAPASIVASPLKPVVADSRELTSVTFTVTDLSGRPVASTPIQFSIPEPANIEVFPAAPRVTDGQGKLTVSLAAADGAYPSATPFTFIASASSAATEVTYWVATTTTWQTWKTSPSYLWPLDGADPLPDLVANLDLNTDGVTGMSGRDKGQAVQITNSQSIYSTQPLDLESSFTLGAWVQPETAGQQALVASTDPTSGSGFAVSVPQTGSATFTLPDINGGALTASIPLSATVPVDQWSWVALTFDAASSVLTVYVNGTRAGSGQVTGEFSPPTQPLVLGSPEVAPNAPEAFNGLMQDVAVWPRALTDTEVTSLYEASTS